MVSTTDCERSELSDIRLFTDCRARSDDARRGSEALCGDQGTATAQCFAVIRPSLAPQLVRRYSGRAFPTARFARNRLERPSPLTGLCRKNLLLTRSKLPPYCPTPHTKKRPPRRGGRFRALCCGLLFSYNGSSDNGVNCYAVGSYAVSNNSSYFLNSNGVDSSGVVVGLLVRTAAGEHRYAESDSQ